MVLYGRNVLGVVLYGCAGEGRVGLAPRRRRRDATPRFRLVCLVAHGFEIGDMRFDRVVDPDQRRRVLRELEALSHDEGDGLSAELDRVVVERAEWAARWRDIVRVTALGEGA